MTFWELVWEVFTEDCLILLPILFLTFFLIEYLEHRAGKKFLAVVERSEKTGPLWGALVGCIPQCGFGVSCAHLYNGGIVTAGTLVAVFLATSDEAIPILLSRPGSWGVIWKLLLIKVVVAVATGYLLDLVWKRSKQKESFKEKHIEHVCHAESTTLKGLLWESLKRTLTVWALLFVVSVALSLLMENIPKESIESFLLAGFFQPFLAALFGFIPNCAASVVLIELYLAGLISFGSAVAGLCSAAGLGILALFRGKRGIKQYLIILGVVYGASVLAGSLLQLF